jgi:hypothetical protein
MVDNRMVTDHIKQHHTLLLGFRRLRLDFNVFSGCLVVFDPKRLEPSGGYQELFFGRSVNTNDFAVNGSVSFLLKLLVDFANVPLEFFRIVVFKVKGKEASEGV